MFALLLVVRGVDGSGVIVRDEMKVAKLVGERFCSAHEVIEVLEFGCNSRNAEINASFARFLCLWRFDQWLDRIVLRLGVR